MLLDILASDNIGQYNLKIAEKLGIEAAAYLDILINVSRKALFKDKLEDEQFLIQRSWVSKTYNIPLDRQYSLDRDFIKIQVLAVDENNRSKLKLNYKMICDLITGTNESLEESVLKLPKVRRAKGGDKKVTAREATIISLKDSIKCDNQELRDALYGWIDGVYANPKGFLSARAIAIFRSTLDKYTQYDLDMALKILEIATTNGYRDCTWAINLFERDYAKTFRQQYKNTEIDRVLDISEETF